MTGGDTREDLSPEQRGPDEPGLGLYSMPRAEGAQWTRLGLVLHALKLLQEGAAVWMVLHSCEISLMFILVIHKFFTCSYLCNAYSQGYGFSTSEVQMRASDPKEIWAGKNWCFWTVVLEKILKSPLDSKEIKPVNPKGDQSCIFTGRTEAEAPILWPPDAKSWLIGKDWCWQRLWAGVEKGVTEDEMVWWHHQLNGQEFE